MRIQNALVINKLNKVNTKYFDMCVINNIYMYMNTQYKLRKNRASTSYINPLCVINNIYLVSKVRNACKHFLPKKSGLQTYFLLVRTIHFCKSKVYYVIFA